MFVCRYPVWPDDFAWSTGGPIAGSTCVHVFEPQGLSLPPLFLSVCTRAHSFSLSRVDAFYSADWLQSDLCYVTSQRNINMTWHPGAKPKGPYTCVEFANADEKSTSVSARVCMCVVYACVACVFAVGQRQRVVVSQYAHKSCLQLAI